MAAFPLPQLIAAAEMNEPRQCLAFRENDITTMEQVAAGMRKRPPSGTCPFLPLSPCQFVAWCKAELATAGFLMPMNWSIWLTSIAARVVYTRCRIISMGIQPITGLSPHCTSNMRAKRSAILSCAASRRTQPHGYHKDKPWRGDPGASYSLVLGGRPLNRAQNPREDCRNGPNSTHGSQIMITA